VKREPRGGAGTPFDPLAFVAQHGIVLASARGPVPNLAEAIAGEPIRGSWWAHERSHDIFRALTALDDSEDVLCFKLVADKVTFVHRRLWPALVRLADELGRDRLAAVQQEHTATGAHRNTLTPFPDWVPADVRREAAALDPASARAQLGPWSAAPRPAPKRAPKKPAAKTRSRS
jgi:hypothetical protein